MCNNAPNKLIESAKEQQSCQCLDQISGSGEFFLNLLQKSSMGIGFWQANVFPNQCVTAAVL